MICKCGKSMFHLGCDDRSQQAEPDLCYNLYNCECGTILIEDIRHSRNTWYDSTNGTIQENSV